MRKFKALIVNTALLITSAVLIGYSSSLIVNNMLLATLLTCLSATLMWLRVARILAMSTLLTNISFCTSISVFCYASTLGLTGILGGVVAMLPLTMAFLWRDMRLRERLVKSVIEEVAKSVEELGRDLTYR